MSRKESSVELDLEERTNECLCDGPLPRKNAQWLIKGERERERGRRGEGKMASLFEGRERIFNERSFINDRMIESGSVACVASVMRG